MPELGVTLVGDVPDLVGRILGGEGDATAGDFLRETLTSWLPPDARRVLVLARDPQPLARLLRGLSFTATVWTGEGATDPGTPDPPAGGVLAVDDEDEAALRVRLAAARAALPASAPLMVVSARRNAAPCEPDGVLLLLDEAGFRVSEVRTATAGRCGGGSGSAALEVVVRRARCDEVLIRGYRQGDEAEILPMFHEVFGSERSEAHWAWKYRDDPYGTVKISEAFDSSGRLVGHYAGVPVRFVWPSRVEGEVPSLHIGDIMTRREARGAGIGERSVLTRITRDFYERHCVGRSFFNYGLVTGHHLTLGRRYLGYVYIDPVTLWRRASTAPVRPLLARSLGYRARAVGAVSAEWDAFLAAVAPSYGLLLRRDARYLAWRYLSCPDHVHTVVEVRRRGALVGWGVFARRGPVLFLGDALLERGGARWALEALLACAERLHPGVETVEAWFSSNPSWWPAVLRKAGFESRPEPNGLTPGFTLFGPLPSQADLEGHLYLAAGDTDLF